MRDQTSEWGSEELGALQTALASASAEHTAAWRRAEASLRGMAYVRARSAHAQATSIEGGVGAALQSPFRGPQTAAALAERIRRIRILTGEIGSAAGERAA